MSDLHGSAALPGALSKMLEPLARALEEASPATSHRLREATEAVTGKLTAWVIVTPEIGAALRKACSAATCLADALDRRNEVAAQSAKVDAQDAFRRLVAALLTARPNELKAAIGLGW